MKHAGEEVWVTPGALICPSCGYVMKAQVIKVPIIRAQCSTSNCERYGVEYEVRAIRGRAVRVPDSDKKL